MRAGPRIEVRGFGLTGRDALLSIATAARSSRQQELLKQASAALDAIEGGEL